MNCYISGCSGFLGTAIKNHLLSFGNNVYTIPRSQTIKKLLKLFRFAAPEYIYHLGSYGNHYNQKDFAKMVEANIINTYNILEALRPFPYTTFYNFSTSSVLLKHKTDYAITKQCGERLALTYRNVINIRPYSVYGPGEARHRFIPTVIDCLNTGREMLLDKDAAHAWLFIDDFIKALFAEETELGGEMVTNNEIVTILENISGKKLKSIPAKLRDYDCGDVKAPGICYTNLYDGLKETYEYFTR